MGTSSGTRVRAWRPRRSTGSVRSGEGSKTAWLERGTSARAAFPRATRSSTLKWGVATTARPLAAVAVRLRSLVVVAMSAMLPDFGSHASPDLGDRGHQLPYVLRTGG